MDDFYFSEQVSPEDPSMEWKDLTDRAANTAFLSEIFSGNTCNSIIAIIVILHIGSILNTDIKTIFLIFCYSMV